MKKKNNSKRKANVTKKQIENFFTFICNISLPAVSVTEYKGPTAMHDLATTVYRQNKKKKKNKINKMKIEKRGKRKGNDMKIWKVGRKAGQIEEEKERNEHGERLTDRMKKF